MPRLRVEGRWQIVCPWKLESERGASITRAPRNHVFDPAQGVDPLPIRFECR